ncbi:MAG TPA: hypothetical protein VIY27_08310 [Myxococcota bacterium]
MYRVHRPRRLLGDAPPPRERSAWPLLLAGGVVFGLVLAGVTYMGKRTAQMQASSSAARRWG